jgi:hypothetical protein
VVGQGDIEMGIVFRWKQGLTKSTLAAEFGAEHEMISKKY